MSASNFLHQRADDGSKPLSTPEQLLVMIRDGRFQEAATACGEWIVERPDDGAPYLCLAQLAQIAGDLQQAANFLGEAIVREPANGAAFAHLSEVLWGLDRKEFSIRALDTAIALGVNDADQHRLLADRLYQTGMNDQARSVYARVLEIDPNCLRSRAMLSLIPAASFDLDRSNAEMRYQNRGAILNRKPEWRRVHLCLIAPPGYSHVKAFAEFISSFENSFRRLGCSTTSALNETRRDAVNIVFGGHLLGGHVTPGLLPRATVFFNLEQADGFGIERFPLYKDLLQKYPVWDYSERNAGMLRKIGANVCVLRVGYEAVLEKIPRSDKFDCDVLFYGSINARREAVLRDLRSAGLTVRHLFNVYDDERDRAIASAKMVLNLHYYEDAIHEIVRTSFLLANRKAVVSECNANTEIDEDIRDAVRAVRYEEIVQACLELARSDAARQKLEDRGYEIFKRRDQVESVSAAIENTGFVAMGT